MKNSNSKIYHQISLHPDSRDLTLFACHKGIFCLGILLHSPYLSVFGMSAAAEIYQRHIEHALAGLPGVKNISDDIIVGGKDNAVVHLRLYHK